MWFAFNREDTFPFDRRMFWAIVCFMLAVLAVCESCRLREEDDAFEPLCASEWEKIFPIVS
jgi:hypothetical protein